MNDRLFWLFLGLTIFAVFYAVFMGYIFYQDSKHKIVRSKKGNILVIFLAVALVISISAIGYLFIQNKQLQNQDSAPTNNFLVPTPVSTPAPTIDPTANWKNYTDKKYGFSLKYPQEWSISENKTYVYAKPDPNVLLKGVGVKENWTIEKELKMLIGEQTPGVVNSEVSNILTVTIANTTGKQFTVSTPAGANIREYIVEKNGSLYVFIRPSNDSDRKFDQILSTFKFL